MIVNSQALFRPVARVVGVANEDVVVTSQSLFRPFSRVVGVANEDVVVVTWVALMSGVA